MAASSSISRFDGSFDATHRADSYEGYYSIGNCLPSKTEETLMDSESDAYAPNQLLQGDSMTGLDNIGHRSIEVEMGQHRQLNSRDQLALRGASGQQLTDRMFQLPSIPQLRAPFFQSQPAHGNNFLPQHLHHGTPLNSPAPVSHPHTPNQPVTPNHPLTPGHHTLVHSHPCTPHPHTPCTPNTPSNSTTMAANRIKHFQFPPPDPLCREMMLRYQQPLMHTNSNPELASYSTIQSSDSITNLHLTEYLPKRHDNAQSTGFGLEHELDSMPVLPPIIVQDDVLTATSQQHLGCYAEAPSDTVISLSTGRESLQFRPQVVGHKVTSTMIPTSPQHQHLMFTQPPSFVSKSSDEACSTLNVHSQPEIRVEQYRDDDYHYLQQQQQLAKRQLEQQQLDASTQLAPMMQQQHLLQVPLFPRMDTYSSDESEEKFVPTTNVQLRDNFVTTLDSKVKSTESRTKIETFLAVVDKVSVVGDRRRRASADPDKYTKRSSVLAAQSQPDDVQPTLTVSTDAGKHDGTSDDNIFQKPSTRMKSEGRTPYTGKGSNTINSGVTRKSPGSSDRAASPEKNSDNSFHHKPKKSRPEPLVIPPQVNHFGFQSRLRSPRLWSGTPFNMLVPSYTPPPMLSPIRSGPGLFWTIPSTYKPITPKSAPMFRLLSMPLKSKLIVCS